MTELKRTIRQYGEVTEPSSLEQLLELARRYGLARNYFLSRYSGINSLDLLPNHRKNIRDALMKTDVPKQFKLSARYWKNSLDESVGTIKSEWSNTKNRMRDAVSKNAGLSEDEKHYIYYVLKSPSIFKAILCRKSFDVPKNLPDIANRTHTIHNLIRRYARRYKGNISTMKKKNQVMVDSDMYNYCLVDGQLFLEVAGLKKGKRLKIRLNDHNRHTGNLRIIINGTRIVVCATTTVKTPAKRSKKKALGIDKGYTSLFATSSDKEYGKQLGVFMSKETDRLNIKNQKRNKIWAQIAHCKKTGDICICQLKNGPHFQLKSGPLNQLFLIQEIVSSNL
jgi:hypothetical protein